jgi:hypothetical protein
MSDRCCFNRWKAAREEDNTPKTIVFVATDTGYFHTWGEDARQALRALGGGPMILCGGVAFLSVARKHWHEDRDRLLRAGYTVRVVS